jgi:AcrR family transcriptional regulator
MATGLRERKKAETRRRLLTEALRLFIEQGYEATTLEEIAAAANVSARTLLRYFGSKADLVYADQRRYLDGFLGSFHDHRVDGQTAMAALRLGLLDLSSALEQDRDMILAQGTLVVENPALLTIAAAAGAEWQQALVGALEGCDDVPRRADQPPAMRVQLTAAAALATVAVVLRCWRMGGAAKPIPSLMAEALLQLPASVARLAVD